MNTKTIISALAVAAFLCGVSSTVVSAQSTAADTKKTAPVASESAKKPADSKPVENKSK